MKGSILNIREVIKMVAIKFDFPIGQFWLIHLTQIPKVGEGISVVTRDHVPMGTFYIAGWRAMENNCRVGYLTKLNNKTNGMSVVAEPTTAPESP